MATGISISSTSNLTTGQKILVANAKMAFEPAAPDPDLVMNDRIPQGHKQWDVLTYARLAQATALTEGTDLAQSEQLVAATVTITPSEHGIIATLSKRLIRRQGDTAVVSTAGTLIGNSLRRRQANDVIALYDGASRSTPGASLAIDVTTFRGAVAFLLTDNDAAYGPAPLPLYAALHIEQISDIILDITDPGAVVSSRFGLSAELMQRWWRGNDRLYGVGIFHSGLISRDANGDSKGVIMAQTANQLVMANDAEPTEETDNSLRAIEYGLFQEWGESEIADPHMIEIFSDSSSTLT